MDEVRAKVLIIGAGPAGYTAAIYAARANLSPILVSGIQPGGQLMITTDVENFPGFAERIEGPWLVEQMAQQAIGVGTRIMMDHIESVDFNKRPFRAKGGKTYIADAVIIATGAQARWLGLESESFFRGFGVSACATCDGFFFRDKHVAVVGGGNTAVEEALYLTNHALKVTLIHRRSILRAEQIMQQRLLDHPKIEVIWDSVVEEIHGSTQPLRSVTGARLRNVCSGEVADMELDGLFVAIGHDPASSLCEGQLSLTPSGHIEIPGWSTKTSIEGVFAAGDVADPHYRQAVTAAGMGCMAALEAERFLAFGSVEQNQARETEPA